MSTNSPTGSVASSSRLWFQLKSHQFPCELGIRAEQKVSGKYTSFRLVCEGNEWFVYGYKFPRDKDFCSYFFTPAEVHPHFPSWGREEDLLNIVLDPQQRFVDVTAELNRLHHVRIWQLKRTHLKPGKPELLKAA